MHTREDRRRVMISSRLRCGVEWRDALIVNVSSRGVGLSAGSPPSTGSYVEIRRGVHLIIARVIWVNGGRFGVQTQDRVAVQSLIRQSDASTAAQPVNDATVPAERRKLARVAAEKHERSRAFGRVFEFACVAALGASAALVGCYAVGQALQQPLESVHEALSN